MAKDDNEYNDENENKSYTDIMRIMTNMLMMMRMTIMMTPIVAMKMNRPKCWASDRMASARMAMDTTGIDLVQTAA